jgi:putative redox protein
VKDYTLSLEWLGNRDFNALVDGAGPTFVSQDKPWPTHLLLEALASCGAMTLLDILGKMALPVTGMRVKVRATRPENPEACFSEIDVVYQLEGGPFPPGRLDRALELAGKYCTVRRCLHPGILVVTSWEIAGQEI